MRKAAFVLFITLSLTLTAQDNKQDNPIDKRLKHCLDSTQSTTLSMIECTYQAYTEWDQELNKYYKLLLKEFGESQSSVLLKSAQISWLSYRDKEFGLIDKIYDNDGTMWGPIRVNRRMEIVRSRALELKEYYEIMTMH